MPAEIITATFCADYWGRFKVKGSANQEYIVTMDGSEGVAHCTCPAYEYSRDRNCKHIGQVFRAGCFWNPQWYEGGPRTIKPFSYTKMPVADESCPACGGWVVPVRIAV